MSYLLNNEQKFNDIIFATRNKNYGAYVIRSEYGNTVFKALLYVLLAIGLFVFATYYFGNSVPITKFKIETINCPIDEKIYEIPVDLERQLEKPKSDLPKTEPVKPTQELSTNISDSASVNTNTVTNEDSGSATSLTTTSTGNENVFTGGTNSLSIGNKTSTLGTKSDPVIIPDSYPEFEGGVSALMSFIRDNVHYPVEAIERGVEGTVYVKFVVDENGFVVSPTLLNKKGSGLDEEAVRVVSLIPKFKTPGKMGGNPVKVYFQLPIKFRIR